MSTDLKAHLFICTNSPDKVGKCGSKNAEALRKSLKERCAKEPWASEVRINSAGCLNHCEHGITAVLYPKAEWHLDLKADKASEDLLFNCVQSAVQERNK